MAVGASAIGARVIGAKAIGALAVGAVALGAVAIGRLAIGRARIRQLRIERARGRPPAGAGARGGVGAPPGPSPLETNRARSGASALARRYDPRALPTGMPRRLMLAALAAALLALLVAAPSALADTFTPESGGSPNADDIDTLYKITLYVAIVIFLIVEGTLIWSLVRYRRRRGGPEAAQIRGNTPLELGWTIGRGADPGRAHGRHVRLPARHREPARVRPGRACRPRRRASPRSTSPRRPAAGPTCSIERQRPAVPLALRLPGQADAVQLPHDGRAGGHDGRAGDHLLGRDPLVVDPEARRQGRRRCPATSNETWFKIPADQAGTIFKGQCAELCGSGHADMRAAVRAVTPEEYQALGRAAGQRHRGVRQAARRAAQGDARARTAPDGSRNRRTPPASPARRSSCTSSSPPRAAGSRG